MAPGGPGALPLRGYRSGSSRALVAKARRSRDAIRRTKDVPCANPSSNRRDRQDSNLNVIS